MATENLQNVEHSADEFWNWFQLVAPQLADDTTSEQLLAALDSRIQELNPCLSWEIGPGLQKPLQLVISPNLDRSLRVVARQIVSRAPELLQWEFHAARQPKDWDYRVEVRVGQDRRPIELDASRWTFVLLKYPDGTHEVLLRGNGSTGLTDEDRWQAAAIVLESVVGEETLLDRIDEFDLVDDLEPRFASQQRPIAVLRQALGGA